MKYTIPQMVIDKIKDAANIVDVVSDFVALKKAGVNYKGLCPFHTDNTPSLMVSPAKGICKCFACGEGGDAVTFIQKHEQLSYPEALKFLAKKYGIEVPQVEKTPEEISLEKERESIKAVLVATQKIFEGSLAMSDDARQYLAKRETDANIQQVYGIGFAPGHGYLVKALKEQGYKEEFLIKAGVARKKDNGYLVDKFFDRIMFPFYSRRGELIGFTGRMLHYDGEGAKYSNTEETALFHKGNELFGFYQAKKSIAKEGFVYVVEGQFDVVSMAQRGVTNIIAGSGTAFTEQQIKLIRTITTNVVYIYDDDNAGHKAALKQIEASVKASMTVRCVMLQGGQDPDDLAKAKGKEVGKWLKKNTITYVEALTQILYHESDDALSRAEQIKYIVGIIANESIHTKKVLLKELAGIVGEDMDYLLQVLESVQVPEKPDTFKIGYEGWDFAEPYIDNSAKSIHATSDWELYSKRSGEKEPWLFFHGIPTEADNQDLNRRVARVIFHKVSFGGNDIAECDDILIMKALYQMGVVVDVSVKRDGEDREQGFLFAYTSFYGSLIETTCPTPEVKNVYLSRCAEAISFASTSIQTVNMKSWAESLGIKVSELKEIVKPFNAERKATSRLERERGDLADNLYDFDPEKIPPYVKENEEYSTMLRRYNFFPMLGKESKEPVCYMFRTEGGQLKRVADFYMEPLFHVYDREAGSNRRVIKLTSLYNKGSKFVEIPSKAFQKLSTLDEFLIGEGAYNFENGTATEYGKIRACMSYKFPIVEELKVLGQQMNGSFVWANAILHEVKGVWQLDYADEMGLLPDDERTYYSPAYSKVNLSWSMDNDPFEQDRKLTYNDVDVKKRVTFKHWAELMSEVYKVNNNGDWAIIYAIMCCFRSVIYKAMPNHIFTAIFFIGPTMSGKTQIALSIRSLFIKPDVASFNLNSGTDAAFFSVLERFRDVPQVFEEYNDEEISDAKFQGLKSVTYDGDGKQKRKAATGNDIETSKVNAPVVLLGQEAPQRDDGALANRVVLCEVPIREDINEDHARKIFEELKGYEQDGLSYLLIEVLKLRNVFAQHFMEVHRESVRTLQEEVEKNGQRNGNQTRIINTVAMFVSTVKILNSYAPYLELPFTYEQFFNMAVAKVRGQIEMITSTNKLATFFDIFDILIDKSQGGIKMGRDFRIVEGRTEIKLKGGKSYHVPTIKTKLLYMRIDPIHQAYMKAFSGDHPLTKTTLMMNLRSDSAYVGEVSACKFEWEEAEEKAVTVENPSLIPSEKVAASRYMVKKQTNTSAIVLNYSILSEHYGKDFERKPDNVI